MDKCPYYKGTDLIGTETTKILCSYMTSGGKVFNNKDPEGAALIQCCWHAGENCPIMAENGEPAPIQNSFDEIPPDVDDVDGIDEEEQPVEQEQQTFTTDVATSTNTQVSTERQKKALELTSRITVRYEIVRQYLLEIARDLTIVNDEKLFLEMGVKDFDEYCDHIAGFGSRQGYNFIKIYKRFGEENLPELQHLGSTKLTDMADLCDEDLEDLMSKYNVETLSTRELRKKINEYKNKYEQLTLLLEDEKSKSAESASLESQVEELKKQLEAAKQEKEAQNAETAKEKEALFAQLRELESRPAEISEEERNALIQQGRDEMSKEKDKLLDTTIAVAKKTAVRETEKKLASEIDKLKAENDALREKAERAKESTAKMYEDELEKLKSENAALQSNAQPAPAPAPTSGVKDKVKFYLSQIKAAFNAAAEAMGEADDEERETIKTALKTALGRMNDDLNNR